MGDGGIQESECDKSDGTDEGGQLCGDIMVNQARGGGGDSESQRGGEY